MAEDTERWRGQVDSFMQESARDRAGIHQEIRSLDDRADERHAELVREIRDAGHAMRDAMNAVRLEGAALAKAAHARADEAHAHAVSAHARIQTWEARAEGASWVSKHLPAGIAGAIGWLVAWFTTGRPPGGQ